jgi:hypothetical protein
LDAPAVLAALGEWYALRGCDEWAADLLERARAGGAAVPPLLLARLNWRLERWERAAAGFEAAIARHEAPEPYLRQCLAAVRDRR